MATETMDMYTARRSQDRNAELISTNVTYTGCGECTSLVRSMVSRIRCRVLEQQRPEQRPLNEGFAVIIVASVRNT
jgi:hypothetical protein